MTSGSGFSSASTMPSVTLVTMLTVSTWMGASGTGRPMMSAERMQKPCAMFCGHGGKGGREVREGRVQGGA